MSIFVLLHAGLRGIEIQGHSVEGDSLVKLMEDRMERENREAMSRCESEVSEWIQSIYDHRHENSAVPVSTKEEILNAWKYENLIRNLADAGQDLNHDWRGDLPGTDSTKNLVGRWECQTLTWEVWELLSPSEKDGSLDR